MDEAQFKARIEQIFTALERYSYYDLLNLAPGAPPDAIRAAFHRMAASMHPDRFHAHPDAELRDRVYAIYKRMAEGYRILMDSSARKAYDQALPQGQLRLQQTERKRSGPRRAEDAIEHPQGKKFFQLALTAERRGDFKGARMNYKLAQSLIGEHPAISESLTRLDEAEAKKQEKEGS